MKKYDCLLLFLAIACCNAAGAQVETKPAAGAQTQAASLHHPHRWSLDGTGGAAIPIGQFAHTDVGNLKSGPVHPGSLLELGVTYHLNHTLGVTLLASRQYHHSEADELIDLVPGAEYLVPGPFNGNSGLATPVGPQHWTMTRILAGGVYTLPLNPKKNLALLFRALAGLQQTHTSQYEYFVQVQGGTGFSSYPPRNLAWAFSYQADAGLQWKVYRRWSLLAFAGYNGSRPPYKQNITDFLMTIGSTPPGSQYYQKIHFPTGSILLRAGVGFDL